MMFISKSTKGRVQRGENNPPRKGHSMGECGCGEMNIIDSFFVGNKVLAIDLYRGCRYCGADIGLKLYIFTKKEAKFWDIKTKEQFKLEKTEMNCRLLFWIGMDDIIKAILGYQNEIPDYLELKDFLEERANDILEDALKFAEGRNKKE